MMDAADTKTLIDRQIGSQKYQNNVNPLLKVVPNNCSVSTYLRNIYIHF